MKQSYVIASVKKKNDERDTNYAVAFINLLPAVVYAFVIAQQVFGEQSFAIRLLVWIGFIILYMALMWVPFASFLVCIASTYIIGGFAWAACDLVSNNVVCVILKIITGGFIGLLELSIAVNLTFKK